jgi:hypothetical protein
MTMKKFAIVTAAALLVASVSGAYAETSSRHHKVSHHKMAPGMTTGTNMKSSRSLPGNNDELKGNNGNSAGGNNSLANTNNPGNGGVGNNAGPPMK